MDINIAELEQHLFNKQTKMDKAEIEKAIIETQQKLYSLMAMVNKSNETSAFSLDHDVFRDIEKRYPFLRSIHEDQGQVVISCRKMPLEIKASVSSISDAWHEGTIYVSNTGFDFDIFARTRTTSSDTTTPYKFSNNTKEIKKHADMLYNPFITESIRHDFLGVTYQPVTTSSRHMAHPHSDDRYRVFSNVCYGTNLFSDLLSKGISNKSMFYNFVRFVLLWLETGNFEDWYANLITQKYQLQPNLVDDSDDRVAICDHLSETFATLQTLIRFLYSSDTLESSSEMEIRRGLHNFSQKLQAHRDSLIPFIGRGFTDKEGQAARIELYSPVKNLRAYIQDIEALLQAEAVNMGYLIAKSATYKLYNTFYAASVFAAAKVASGSLRPFCDPPVINLLINDLMPEIADIQYMRDSLDLESVYNSRQFFKVLNAPYVFNRYLKDHGYRSGWADKYLPSTPVFEEPVVSDYAKKLMFY